MVVTQVHYYHNVAWDFGAHMIMLTKSVAKENKAAMVEKGDVSRQTARCVAGVLC